MNLMLRALFGVIVQTGVFCLFLFLPAGTIAWFNGWIFVGAVLVASVASILAIARHDPALLRERMKPPIQRGQPLVDKIVLIAFVGSFVGVIVFAASDFWRLHLLPIPSPFVSAIGSGLFLVGWWICYRALRDNSFAAPVVKHQADRGQHVVDTGLYRYVRHPMYAGALPLIVGMPLWLQSYAATIAAVLPIFLIALRITVEEQFLRRELPGYDDYTRHVRSRLIPYVW
jgi:protein-S-isoprenylcysteine O-methyltransferase Ste14